MISIRRAVSSDVEALISFDLIVPQVGDRRECIQTIDVNRVYGLRPVIDSRKHFRQCCCPITKNFFRTIEHRQKRWLFPCTT